MPYSQAISPTDFGKDQRLSKVTGGENTKFLKIAFEHGISR